MPNPVAGIDFANAWPVVVVGPNSSLTLRGLVISGLPPFALAVTSPQYPRPATVSSDGSNFALGGLGLALYPSVILEDDSQVRGVQGTKWSRGQMGSKN